jgi:hypothetical protein
MSNITSREAETFRPFPAPVAYECTICLDTDNLREQGLTGQLICTDVQSCEARFARWEARQ